MGDRSNVFIQMTKRTGVAADKPDTQLWDGIGVYSHWGGADFHARALDLLPKAIGRVGDEQYFTRVLVQNLLNESFDADSLTGGGLWTENPGDNQHPILVINAHTGNSWFASEETYRVELDKATA